MKTAPTISIACCLLLFCSAAIAQEAGPPAVADIFSAIPGDAYGFVAVKNPQIFGANYMAFLRAVCPPSVFDSVADDLDAWTAILEVLDVDIRVGPIDRNGPSGVVLLDPQKFGDYWGAVLFRASDPQAILRTHKAKAQDSDVDLPAGVVKVERGTFLGAKDGFIVFASGPEAVAAVINSETSFEIMPSAREAFDKGQIVFGADLQQAGPFMLQALNMARDRMTAQMGPAIEIPEMATLVDIFSWEIAIAQALIEQSDKLTVALDMNGDRAVLTKRVLFKDDSSVATFMNAQMGQEPPSYAALPGGPFLLAAGSNLVPQNKQVLTDFLVGGLMNLPGVKKGFSDEQIQQMLADCKAKNALLSGMAVTLNLGSPMTGMINMVSRYDVSDSALLKELSKKESSAGGSASMWIKLFDAPLKFVYTSAAENYSGVDIDTIKMEITGPEAGVVDDPMMVRQMQPTMAMMYGPDMTFRLAAPNEKQVLFVIGGSGRMERAINVAQGNGSVLADDARITQAVANLPADRFAEAHLDLSQLMPMMMMIWMMRSTMTGDGGMGAVPPAQPGDTPLISFSVSAEKNILRADMVVPTEAIKPLFEMFMHTSIRVPIEGGGHPPGFEDDDF